MITPSEHRYAERPTCFIGITEFRGWMLKNYEITLDGSTIARSTRDAADEVVKRQLATDLLEPWLGFVILHAAKDAVWLLIDLWQDDLLYHTLYRAALDTPTAFAPHPPDGPTACVWELQVIAHEWKAYVRAAAESEKKTQAEAYKADTSGALGPSPIKQCG